MTQDEADDKAKRSWGELGGAFLEDGNYKVGENVWRGGWYEKMAFDIYGISRISFEAAFKDAEAKGFVVKP